MVAILHVGMRVTNKASHTTVSSRYTSDVHKDVAAKVAIRLRQGDFFVYVVLWLTFLAPKFFSQRSKRIENIPSALHILLFNNRIGRSHNTKSLGPELEDVVISPFHE